MTTRRFFEFIPGTLSWLTLILMFLLSWITPGFIAIFIILFDIYWLLKTTYLSLHLRATFSIMKKNLKVDWLAKLEELDRDANNTNVMRMHQIAEKELSYRLTGIFLKVHRRLGRFCRERQYGDVLSEEFRNAGIAYKREVPIAIANRKSNFVDFMVDDRVVVELKAKTFIEKEDYYQLQRYLKSAGKHLGMIVNFRQEHLKPKRVLNSDFQTDSRHSSEFVDSHRVTYWKDIYHLVILPMYREPYEVVRESFQSLASRNYPLEKFIVVLATEETGGGEAAETAKKIGQEFGSRFFKFIVTSHPAGLEGEIPGKGSNETWAVKQAKEKIIDTLGINHENILVSVFDVDTQVFPEYFGRLTYVFLKSDSPDGERLRAIYQPIPLFINNVYQAPALARVISFSSTFWQMMQQSRPERLTSFSSQSIPFQTLLDIGYWQTDVVSEDSRSFWQCYLRYHGDFRVEPLFYPVSMDVNAAPTFWGTMKNNYRQHRRWAWGCENIPYLLEGFRKDRLIPLRKKIYWAFNSVEGFHSWATNALLIFALGWLPVILGGKHFNVSLMSYSLPSITRFIVEVSMVGVATSAFFSIFLLPPRLEPLKWHQYIWYLAQWLLLPLTLIVFGCVPALEAQTRMMLGGKWRLGFWVTPKSRI